MDRKTLVAAVGAVALTLVAASGAMAVNLGILDSSSDAPTGGLRPPAPATTTPAPAADGADDPEVIHLTVRDLPPTGTAVTGATGAPAKATPPPAAATAAPTPTSPRVGNHGDHEDDDDDEHEHEEERRDTRRPRRGDDDDD